METVLEFLQILLGAEHECDFVGGVEEYALDVLDQFVDELGFIFENELSLDSQHGVFRRLVDEFVGLHQVGFGVVVDEQDLVVDRE